MRFLILSSLMIALPGCLMETLTVTAIQGEMAAQNASSATRTLSYAKDSQAKTQLQHSINAYAAEHGQYPSSLELLIPNYLASMPTQSNGQPYAYDPATGAIGSGYTTQTPQYPEVTQQDLKNLEKISKGIYLYWESTGSYPQSLDTLTPLYMTDLPKMSNGENYWYNAQTAEVYHPAEKMQAAPSGQFSTGTSSGAGTGGVGVLGETTTAIGIQNQLGNMNNSGTQSTSTRSRNVSRGLSGSHSQKQMDTLKDLGLQ